MSEMELPVPKVSGVWTRGVMVAFERLGLCAEEVCARANLEFAVLNDPTAQIPQSDGDRLWQAAIEISGDPLFGLHAGEHMAARENHILSMLAISGRTLGDGLSASVRYQKIIADYEIVALDDVGPDKALRFLLDPDPTPVGRHRAEFLIMAAQNLMNAMTLNRFHAKEVRFTHPFRGHLEAYERIFECPVLFEQGETSIVIPHDAWNMKLEVWDPFLRNRLESIAAELHARIQEPGFISTASRAIQELLPQGAYDLAAVAKRLRVSDRTLQRRLHEEGTSFRESLDATRRSLVEKALNHDVDHDEIARLAGFGSVRALRRSIQRWEGESEA